jgi:hypothetical protein
MNYFFVGNCNIKQIVDTLNNASDEIWLEHKFRQTTFSAHKYTNTIEFMWDAGSLYNGSIGKIHDTNYLKFNILEFLESIKLLYEKSYGNGHFIRVMLVKMLANSHIVPHRDYGTSLTYCKRTHIPIITNKNVIFTVNDENKHMKAGEIWEIDNTVIHSVINNSNYDRIHLIIDYVEYEPKLDIKSKSLI